MTALVARPFRTPADGVVARTMLVAAVGVLLAVMAVVLFAPADAATPSSIPGGLALTRGGAPVTAPSGMTGQPPADAQRYGISWAARGGSRLIPPAPVAARSGPAPLEPEPVVQPGWADPGVAAVDDPLVRSTLQGRAPPA